MAYLYEFDDTRLGDYEFSFKSYQLIQEGLKFLLAAVEEWNHLTKQNGAKSVPYKQEAERLTRIISHGQKLLSESGSFVEIKGISVGSMRLLRAGLELILRKRRADLDRNRVAGWPSGALNSLEEVLHELDELARDLEVEPAEILWEVLPQEESAQIVQQVRGENVRTPWDAFISHAWEDKVGFVHPLAESLRDLGLGIWYDQFSLKIGDSLRRSIDKGLSQSRYGIVVLSPSFFAKEWPQRELDGLVAREYAGEKVILPIWHEIDADGVRRHSPTLADKVAVRSQDGLQKVIEKLLAVLRPQN